MPGRTPHGRRWKSSNACGEGWVWGQGRARGRKYDVRDADDSRGRDTSQTLVAETASTIAINRQHDLRWMLLGKMQCICRDALFLIGAERMARVRIRIESRRIR